jgi:hypothetical protein
LVKDENGNLFADSHSILNRWGNCFNWPLHEYGVIDVKQTEKHTFGKVEFAIVKLKRYELPDFDHILTDLTKQVT